MEKNSNVYKIIKWTHTFTVKGSETSVTVKISR